MYVRLNSVHSFIRMYVEQFQKRGPMYGSIDVLESDWNLLNQIHFILIGESEDYPVFRFEAFLASKGFGDKSAATVIAEGGSQTPYKELNALWQEYIQWRDARLNDPNHRGGRVSSASSPGPL